MTNRQTAAQKKPVPIEPAPTDTEAAASALVLASLREHPFVVAALALASAMVAVAKFPNTPVPESLVARIDRAQADLIVAAGDLDQGFFPEMTALVADPAQPQNLDWVQEKFDSLAEALKIKFEEVDTAISQRLEATSEKISSEILASLDERIARAVSAATPPPADTVQA